MGGAGTLSSTATLSGNVNQVQKAVKLTAIPPPPVHTLQALHSVQHLQQPVHASLLLAYTAMDHTLLLSCCQHPCAFLAGSPWLLLLLPRPWSYVLLQAQPPVLPTSFAVYRAQSHCIPQLSALPAPRIYPPATHHCCCCAPVCGCPCQLCWAQPVVVHPLALLVQEQILLVVCADEQHAAAWPDAQATEAAQSGLEHHRDLTAARGRQGQARQQQQQQHHGTWLIRSLPLSERACQRGPDCHSCCMLQCVMLRGTEGAPAECVAPAAAALCAMARLLLRAADARQLHHNKFGCQALVHQQPACCCCCAAAAAVCNSGCSNNCPRLLTTLPAKLDAMVA